MQRIIGLVSALWLVGCVGLAPSGGTQEPAAGTDAGTSGTGNDGSTGPSDSTIDASPQQDPDDPDAAAAALPGDNVQWINYPEQQSLSNQSWGDKLTDIVRHLPSQYGNTYYDSDKITHGHETSHGIHAHLRNTENNTGQQANGFYVFDNRAAIIVEPNIRKSHVAAYVPQELRGTRFSLYITGSSAWDDTPLYVWDEWNAYVNGGEVGVDLVNSGKWTYPWRDGVMGQLEFAVYAIAVARAVAEHDATYFAQNTQFKEFLAWNLRRCMSSYREGAAMSAFAWDRQDSYYEALRTSAAAAPIRDFVTATYSAEFTALLFDL